MHVPMVAHSAPLWEHPTFGRALGVYAEPVSVAAAPIPDVATTLRRATLGYRLVSAAWLSLLGLLTLADRAEPPESPGVVVLTIFVVLAWTSVAASVTLRRPRLLGSVTFIVVDAAVAIGSVMAADWAGTIVFAGGYPLAAVFAALASRGTLAGMLVAGSLSVTALVRIGRITGVDAGELSVVIVYLIAGGVAAWAFEVIRRADDRRRRAEAALLTERTERARAAERADLASRIHDSVLQTLALIQREGEDPRRVRQLARRQERELRDWLFSEPDSGNAPPGFREALTAVCADVEAMTGIAASLVIVGDAPPGRRADAIVAAAREAVINAAKHAGVEEVSVFGQADGDGLQVFVRDRGVGFDPDAIAPTRRGISGSMAGRLEPLGGRVEIESSPDTGTEVRLALPWVETDD